MKVTKLLGWIALCEAVGLISSVFTINSIPTWYAALYKPVFSPPNWVFGPVWSILYALMGIAAFLVWSKKDGKKKLKNFYLQLALNFFWSIIFFGLHLPLLAFIEIVFLWLVIVLTIKDFRKVSRPAAYLLYPYLAWVSFASILNLSVALLNP